MGESLFWAKQCAKCLLDISHLICTWAWVGNCRPHLTEDTNQRLGNLDQSWFKPSIAQLQSILRLSVLLQVVCAVLCTHTCACTYTRPCVHKLHTQTRAHRYTQAVITSCLPFCLLFYFLLNIIIWWAFYDCHVNTRLESVSINFDSFKLNFKQISLESLFSTVYQPSSSGSRHTAHPALTTPPPGLVSLLELGVEDWGRWTPQLAEEI